MKFKIDENLPAELVDDLLGLGHEADTVHTEGLTGAADPVLVRSSKQEGRTFLTMDKGIADIRAYPPADYDGIVLFRPTSSGRKAVLDFIRRSLPELLKIELKGRLLVVTDAGIRIR